LTNRTKARAEALAAEFSASKFGSGLQVVDWSERSDALDGAALVVNSSTLGMTGQPGLDLNLDALPVTATVNDIVYAPLMTDLLVRAKARGHGVVDGLGMLLHQARPGFAAWFGHEPEVNDALRAHIVADL